MKQIKCIAFDLDDTLVDTCGQLVPAALRECYQVFQAAGVTLSESDFKAEHSLFMRTSPTENFFQHFAERNLIGDTSSVAREARDRFYRYEINTPFVVFDEVPAMLERLRKQYSLHLVTMGFPEKQHLKLKILGIEDFFKKVWFANYTENVKKGESFSQILTEEKLSPEQLLCVGNRLDHEIADANQLGCKTCLVLHGEYRHQKPKDKFENADVIINNIGELESSCKLTPQPN